MRHAARRIRGRGLGRLRSSLVAVAAVAAGLTALAPAASATHGEYNADNPGETLTHPTYITCESATLFGGYRDGQHRDPIYTLWRGDRVGWRYSTQDGRSAMVLHYANDQWGFVLRECLEFSGPPGYRG